MSCDRVIRPKITVVRALAIAAALDPAGAASLRRILHAPTPGNEPTNDIMRAQRAYRRRLRNTRAVPPGRR